MSAAPAVPGQEKMQKDNWRHKGKDGQYGRILSHMQGFAGGDFYGNL